MKISQLLCAPEPSSISPPAQVASSKLDWISNQVIGSISLDKAVEVLNQASLPPTNHYRCGICKGLGHNRLRCPKVAGLEETVEIGPGKLCRCTQCGRRGHNRRTCSKEPIPLFASPVILVTQLGHPLRRGFEGL